MKARYPTDPNTKRQHGVQWKLHVEQAFQAPWGSLGWDRFDEWASCDVAQQAQEHVRDVVARFADGPYGDIRAHTIAGMSAGIGQSHG